MDEAIQKSKAAIAAAGRVGKKRSARNTMKGRGLPDVAFVASMGIGAAAIVRRR